MEPKPLKRRRRKRDYIAPVLAIVAIVFAAWSYARRGRQHPLPENPAEVRTALLKEIPKGTRLTKAQRVMGEWGFECMTLTKSLFAGQGPFDFLYCDRDDTSGMSSVRRRWQVALVQVNGGVEDVLVTTGQIGP